MKKAALSLLFPLLFSSLLFAQQKPVPYAAYWQRVQKHELARLPKSAAAVVDTIFSLAQKEENSPQRIKALLYQSKFSLILEEDAQLKIIKNFKQEIAGSRFPEKNILESILASLYWEYYKQNRWQLYNRSHTESKVDSTDFRTWDLRNLYSEIHTHFQNSLKNEQAAQQTNLATYNALLETEKFSKTYRPTLFDFLANQALEFYSSPEPAIRQVASEFEVDNPALFNPFGQVQLEPSDSLSLHLPALKIYQQLISLHQKDTDPSALVIILLERLKFLRKFATIREKETLYLDGINQLKEAYKKYQVSTLVDFERATFHYNQGEEYRPGRKEENRFEKARAFKIGREALARFPKSVGAKQCAELLQLIKADKLSITAERYIPIASPSRLLLDYQNIDTVSFRLYKISRAEQQRLYEINRTYGDSILLSSISQLKGIHQWQQRLRNEKDFQQHETEVVVPPLQQGIYLLIARPGSGAIRPGALFAFNFLQVTNLALLERSKGEKNSYQVINRLSGKPIPGAAVRLTNELKNPELSPFITPLKANSQGFVEVHRSRKPQDVQAMVSHQGDTAWLGSYYIRQFYRPSAREPEQIRIKPFLFTDRSIYRPGQKVYFKGILLRKREGKSEIVSGEYLEVYAEDVNGQEVYFERVKTNEFGSFSGEFMLPASGLTGEYMLGVDEDFEEDNKLYDEDYEFEWLEHSFSVEEYKRPTFEAEIEAVTETYKLKDTIRLKGTATAFAGNTVPDAKVVYTVKRRAEYPGWFSSYRPFYFRTSVPTEITHGETTTNASGAFFIDFAALPDPSVGKEGLPVFHYEVSADVTSLSGETRSAFSTVKVGYHSLVVQIEAPQEVNRQTGQLSFSLSSTNLNGQFVPAQGQIKIYKTRHPLHILRSRSWEAPDYQDIPEEKFKALFPHDPYSQEEKEANSSKGKLVAELSFDTSKAKEFTIEKLKKWSTGGYHMELESTDQWKQEVKDEHLFSLFDPEEKSVADQQLFTIETDKTQYAVGEEVVLHLGSAAKELYVTISIEKNHKITQTEVVRLSGNKKQLKISVGSRDNKGFAIHYHYSFFNSFKRGTLPVSVADRRNELEITLLTFRDKLQPGSQQSWSFQIRGPKKDKAVAEVLASMYDASLDQFKPHRWEFDPIPERTYYASFGSNGNQSFGTSQFLLRNGYRRYFQPTKLHFDQLNWFGFSFTGNPYVVRRYLRQVELSRMYSSAHPSREEGRKKGMIYGSVAGEDGEPLPGVAVQVKGSDEGAMTDWEGSYAIPANEGETLLFSFVGYSTFSVRLEGNNIVDIILIEDVQQLQEVVVTGRGEIVTKNSLGYAVADMAMEEGVMDETTMGMLAGKVPGVQAAAGSPGSGTTIRLRGSSSLAGNNTPLYIVDGVPVGEFDLSPAEILSTEILKGAAATTLYGARAANGVIIITTKSGQQEIENQLAKVNARENFQETAFFFPHLQTDKKGNVSFTFTAPEALSRWKVQLLAHDKNLASSLKTLHTLTQKELMVRPNPPRFLREGDEIVFAATISNLGTEQLNGHAALQLSNALTGEPIDERLNNINRTQPFRVNARGTASLSWSLQIPQGIQAVQFKIVAQAGNFSDGEQNILPVLSNRMLVTETLPLRIRSGQSKTFTLAKLKNANSPTLTHHQLSLEVTSNPVWYAVQALPYLMEYPYECAEQTFARYYANTLAAHLLEANPQIKEVFGQWKTSGDLESPLLKNKELKSLLIKETPWLQDALSESEQKKQIALLFDLHKMKSEGQASIQKLEEMQLPVGGFPWFKGNPYPNRFITLHIASGFGHLSHLKIETPDNSTSAILEKAVHYLDREILKDYKTLQQDHPAILAAVSKKGGLTTGNVAVDQKYISQFHIHYLYMRSFYPEIALGPEVQEALGFYRRQSSLYWKEFNLQMKSMIALSQARQGKVETSRAILQSLRENSITTELGMYWKGNTGGWNRYEAPVETHTLLMEAFAEIEIPGMPATEKAEILDNLKAWLLMNKQTSHWSSTKATTEAIYGILMQGSNWLSTTEQVDVRLGGEKIAPSKLENVQTEAGTGYFKTSWKADEIEPAMSNVQLSKEGDGIAWGALYWQYFEELDKITAAETPLQLSKKLFLKTNTGKGELLQEITASTTLQLGDLVRVRIELKADRDMDFIHMKDMRASGFEPVNVLSHYKWQDGLGYYESTRDASTNFFIDYLPKGVYVFEYDVRVNNRGNFSNGITSIQSMYAPEFSSHSKGVRVVVEGKE